MEFFFSHTKPEDKAHVMTCALKVMKQTMRENSSYLSEKRLVLTCLIFE